MWGLRLNVSAKQMIKLEVGFERAIIPRWPVVALCTYDARKFSGVELLDALKDHNDAYNLPIGEMLAG
jgi:transcriptional repressor of dcmA and dcmR